MIHIAAVDIGQLMSINYILVSELDAYFNETACLYSPKTVLDFANL
jgi:hypothetical protein